MDPKSTTLAVGIILIGIFSLLQLRTGGTFSIEPLYLLPIGAIAWVWNRSLGLAMAGIAGVVGVLTATTTVWDAFMRALSLGIFAWVLPSVKREWIAREQESQIDFLTRTANKQSFMDSASQEIQRALRYQHPFTVAYLDVDNFKFINSRFGHNAGDSLLRAVGQTVRGKIRATDLVARMGEDEFALLLPETQSEAAQIVVSRIQKFLLDAMEKNEWPVTFSVGVMTFLQAPASAQELLEKVISLTAAVKQSGKNAVRHEVIGSTAPFRS